MNDRSIGILREVLAELRSESLIGVQREDIERVAQSLRPHLYDGTFAARLAKMDLFTAEQAEGSTARSREGHELEVEQVLLHFLNEDSSTRTVET